MRAIDRAREERGMSLRAVGRKLGYRNASRVGKYFKQQIYAGPEMVRRLATAVGMSPIWALWESERYRDVFSYLEKLYRLGWSWMRADRVHLDRQAGAIFLITWEGVRDADINEVPPDLMHRYHQATIYNEAGIFRVISLPRPMACAILLGVAMFPRRGEKLRPETRPFWEKLSFVATEMLPQAERARVPSTYSDFTRPLKDAEKILPWGFYGEARLAVVAEYVHAWCDVACKPYADYARLALYESGSFVGEPHENDWWSENLWTWQRAEMPSIEDLKINN
jgi:transcriptional regulator with XRE-family HTH domain